MYYKMLSFESIDSLEEEVTSSKYEMYIYLRNLRDVGWDVSLYPNIRSFKIDNVVLPFLSMKEGEPWFLHVLSRQDGGSSLVFVYHDNNTNRRVLKKLDLSSSFFDFEKQEEDLFKRGIKQHLSTVEPIDREPILFPPFAVKIPPKLDSYWGEWNTEMLGKTTELTKKIDRFYSSLHKELVFFISKIIDDNPSRDEFHILDIGAGTGGLASLIRLRCNEQGVKMNYHFLEPNKDQLDLAKIKLGKTDYFNPIFQNTNYGEGNDGSNIYDIIVASGSVSHAMVVSYESAKSHIYRIYKQLKPGGKALVSGFTRSFFGKTYFELMGFSVKRDLVNNQSLYTLTKPE